MVACEGPRQLGVFREPTESRSVMVDSVEALVHSRDCHGDHLPLRPAQPRRSPHEVGIQSYVVLHGGRIQGVDPDDIVYVHLRATVSPIQLGEGALRLFVRHVGNVRQCSVPFLLVIWCSVTKVSATEHSNAETCPGRRGGANDTPAKGPHIANFLAFQRIRGADLRGTDQDRPARPPAPKRS